MNYLFALICLAASAVHALTLAVDSPGQLVLQDSIAQPQSRTCGDGRFWQPENSVYPGASSQAAIPFRSYTLALPGPALPSLELETLRSEAVQGEPCSLEEAFTLKEGETASRALHMGAPYLRDGLWRVEVRVPLLYSGSAWQMRRSFRLRVAFSGPSTGVNPGKRALASVVNKQGASRFGQRSARSHAMAKAVAGVEGVEWLARIAIGDKDPASLSEDGFYGVRFEDLRTALRSQGLEQELDGLGISSLRLYGYGPDTLPVAVGPLSSSGSSLMEMPLKVSDVDGDGLFDAGDSLYFLGWGTAFWKRMDAIDSSGAHSGMDYFFSSSPYAFRQEYYLGVAGQGKRLGNLASLTGQGADVDWKRYVRAEKDLYLKSAYFGEGANTLEETTGKEWFWVWGSRTSAIQVSSVELSVAQLRNVSGLKGDSAWLGYSFFPHRSLAGRATLSASAYEKRMENISFLPSFQGKDLQGDRTLAPGNIFVYGVSGLLSSGNSYALTLQANASQNDRFDGLSLAYRWDPTKSSGGEWLLPGKARGRVRIPLPAGMQVFKVKDFLPLGYLPVSDGYAQDSIGESEDVRYFVSKPGNVLSPVQISAITPRLDGIFQPSELPSSTEYLIIVPEAFQLQALRLAAFRSSGEAVTTLRTSVVVAEDIYRELGSTPSPVALRDYLRKARSYCPDLRFVLLAGDGHYDYRRIRSSSPVNPLPPFESEDMATDDFFAILDSGETVMYGDYDLDLAVGRLPINTPDEFAIYLQKIREYEQTSLMDNDVWRNTILLLADDAMQREQIDLLDHTRQQERVAHQVDSNALARGFAVDVRKLYLLQYERDASYQKPEAAKDLVNQINQGALFTFYAGHGSSTVWSDESVLKVSSIYELENAPRYTILGSFACTVGRFDESQVHSLSEVFMKTAAKGAIASIGAMRETYSTPNELLESSILYHSLFTPGITLGEAIWRAKGKQRSSYSFNRYNGEKYVLLGEPVISMPATSLDISLNHDYDTLQALQKVALGGSVGAQQGSLRLQVLEGSRSKTLSQDLGDGSSYSADVLLPGGLIHSEETAIQGGKFATEFVTPRKIAFGDTAAQIRLWAWAPGQVQVGRALLSRIAISGTSDYADSLKDTSPPEIRVYTCQGGKSAPFADGQKVSLEIPACLEITVEDSTGLDYREEADEGILFEVIGKVDPWHPWPYLEQSGKRAVARMQFGTKYEAGDYTFQVMAQDILGNVAYRSLQVQLAEGSRQGLSDVFNVPNPMGKSGTTFYFKDLAGDRKNQVTIQIFDQNGRFVQVLRNAQSGVTRWDGRDQHGRLLANGLYHYVVQNALFPAYSGGQRQVFSRKQKLVISR